MDPIQKVDIGALERQAAQAVRDGDAAALGSIIAEVDSRRQAFCRQAQEEDQLSRQTAQELAHIKPKLAFLDPEAARTQYLEQQFAAELHAERAKACQRHGEALGQTLTELRKQSEVLQAQLLTDRVVERAQRLQAKLAEEKKALAPLLATLEGIFALTREVDLFNQTSRHVKLPQLQVHGDLGAIHKLGEIQLHLPPEWRELGRKERRVQFVLPYKGAQRGDVAILPEHDAAAIVSQGWAVPEE